MPGNIQPILPQYQPPCACPYGDCSCIPFTLPTAPSCIQDVVTCPPLFVWPGVPVPVLARCQDLLLPLCPLPDNPLAPRPPIPPFPPANAVPTFTFVMGCPIEPAFPFPAGFPPPVPPCVFDDPPCCPTSGPVPAPPIPADLPITPPARPLVPPKPNVNPPTCNVSTG
jgi:hypothetical protein